METIDGGDKPQGESKQRPSANARTGAKHHDDYPIVKRMIATLDKFLLRRITVIALLYLAGVISCGGVLIANGLKASASSDGGNTYLDTLNVWMYSIIATLTFVFVLILIRFFSLRAAKNKSK